MAGLQINEGHEVAQAMGNSVVTVNATAGGDGFNLTDGNRCYTQGSFGMTCQRVTDAPPGFAYSLKFTVTSPQATLGANDVIHRFQHIEGYTCRRLGWGTVNAQPLTLGWMAKPSIDGQIVTIATANRNEDRNYVSKFVLLANQWQLLTVTVPGCEDGTWFNDNRVGLIPILVLGAGSSYWGTADTWLTGSLLDATSDVTNMAAVNGATFQETGPFVLDGPDFPDVADLPQFVRPMPENLALAQRYYRKSFALDTLPATGVGLGTGESLFLASKNGTAVSSSATISWSTPMRMKPVVSLFNPAGSNAHVRDETLNGDCSNETVTASETGMSVSCKGNSGTVAGNLLGFHYVADAQLYRPLP